MIDVTVYIWKHQMIPIVGQAGSSVGPPALRRHILANFMRSFFASFVSAQKISINQTNEERRHSVFVPIRICGAMKVSDEEERRMLDQNVQLERI